ncbi:MAG: preprotein translocase subunit YajC [Eubacteriales bacterium]
MNYITMLADANSSAGTSGLLSILILVVMLVVMYFIMIRPQKKKDREDAAMRSNLMVGDEITTIGGIIGRVVSIKDETCVIETSKAGTKIRILKTAIRSVDVPVSATKGYVAPAAPAEENSAEEDAPAIEEKTEKSEKKSKKK